jgi:signal transduction histidine kinase/ActR/RegA family two-component response regulator
VFRWQDISIKRKLTWLIMIASGAALLLVAAGFVTYELLTRRQNMTRDLSTLAEVLANESTAAVSFDDTNRCTQILNALRAKKNIVAAALYNESGESLAEYSPAPATPGAFPTHLEANGARFESDHLVAFYQIHLYGKRIGTLYLKSDLKELNERLKRYATIVLLILLVSSTATYFLSSFLQRIISKPIFHLVETAKAVSAEKKYSVRATKHGQDELGQLIDGFNEMLGQIQTRDAALQESNNELEKRVEARTHDLRAEIQERQRAEAALQQQFTRISLLNQITRAISERQDTQSILHVVLRKLEDHLNLDLGSVALFDKDAGTLNVAAVRVKNSMLRTKLDLSEGAVMALKDTGLQPCKEGQTVYLADTVKGSAMLHERLAGAGLRSAVAVPLLVDGQLFGVLLAARLKPNDFSSGDAEFLRTLSEHVALAAHQASLHNELERAYNELRQSQQTVMQQERLKALGQMASGIAHDVNNALSPVVGFADLLIRNEQGLSATGKRHLQHIRTAGEDIAHIVARLREFYRRRDDRESMLELNINHLAEQVVEMTRPRWRDIPQSNGITVEMQTEFAPHVPELIGIESEVREAMTNLVLNAVDALPRGGKITLRTRVTRGEVQLHSPEYLTHVVVEVSDTGTGMNEETRRRCLEPFFSTKGKRGTGLGLAMVYGVMQRHEGDIEIDSELGKGTTFRLVFPVRKAALAITGIQENGPAIEPLQILCIDDEPLLRDLLKEMLERDGHSVEVSDSGQTGLDAFRVARDSGRPFDVIITDLGMPYVDGRQVTKVVKHESPNTPVVMLTGWGAFMKEDDSAPADLDALLSKPPRSKELRETLSRFRRVRKEVSAQTSVEGTAVPFVGHSPN